MKLEDLDEPFPCFYADTNSRCGSATVALHWVHTVGSKECTPAQVFPLCDKHAADSYKRARSQLGQRCSDCGKRYAKVSDLIVDVTLL